MSWDRCGGRVGGGEPYLVSCSNHLSCRSLEIFIDYFFPLASNEPASDIAL